MADDAPPFEPVPSDAAPADAAAEAAKMPADSLLTPDEMKSVLEAAGAASAAAVARSTPAKPSAESTGSDIELLLNQAEAALISVNQPVPPPADLAIKPFKLQDFAGSPASSETATLDLIRDVELDLKIELGRTEMHLEDVLRLKKGSVVPLDKLAGDPVDIFVNGRLIARGEVLVLNDNFCVRVAELVAGDAMQ